MSEETIETTTTETTHFGYQTISSAEKSERVASVFRSVANRYDLMNDLMSFGLHRIWKRLAVARSDIRAHHRVLDLAGGTGDLSLQFAKKVGPLGKVILADINEAMLNKGRERLLDAGISKTISCITANAEELPFEDDYFDRVCIAFGLRNVTYKEKALSEMARVLKPGGRVVILEFSKVNTSMLSSLYDTYSFSVLPKLGEWICRDRESYQYLAESIRMHPDQETLKSMMEDAGFERCEYQNYHNGIVAMHVGYQL